MSPALRRCCGLQSSGGSWASLAPHPCHDLRQEARRGILRERLPERIAPSHRVRGGVALAGHDRAGDEAADDRSEGDPGVRHGEGKALRMLSTRPTAGKPSFGVGRWAMLMKIEGKGTRRTRSFPSWHRTARQPLQRFRRQDRCRRNGRQRQAAFHRLPQLYCRRSGRGHREAWNAALSQGARWGSGDRQDETAVAARAAVSTPAAINDLIGVIGDRASVSTPMTRPQHRSLERPHGFVQRRLSPRGFSRPREEQPGGGGGATAPSPATWSASSGERRAAAPAVAPLVKIDAADTIAPGCMLDREGFELVGRQLPGRRRDPCDLDARQLALEFVRHSSMPRTRRRK